MSNKTITLSVQYGGESFSIGQQINNKSAISDVEQFKLAAAELLVVKKELQPKVAIKHTPKPKPKLKPKPKQEG